MTWRGYSAKALVFLVLYEGFALNLAFVSLRTFLSRQRDTVSYPLALLLTPSVFT